MAQRLVIPVFVLSTLTCAAAAQQQPSPHPPASAQSGDQPRPDEREMMKARLERRIQESKEQQERLERALRLLEQGGATERVREEAGGPMRRLGGRERPEGSRPGMPPEDRGDPNHRPPSEPPTREAMLRFLDEHNPELAGRLRETMRDNPEAADRILKRIEPHFREVAAERDPEMRGFRIQAMRLGWEILSASRDLTDALRKGDEGSEHAAESRERLRTLLGSQFDLQVKMHDREIALLERRLADLRERVQERTESRDSFIADKSAQIESMAKRFAEREPPGDRPPHREGGRKGAPRER